MKQSGFKETQSCHLKIIKIILKKLTNKKIIYKLTLNHI